LFHEKNMDLSVESLKHVETACKKIKKGHLPKEDWWKFILRSGAYTGEVIRKNSKTNFYWIENSELKRQEDVFLQVEEDSACSPWHCVLLWSYPDTRVFPMVRVLKHIDNRRKYGIVHFADHLIRL